MSRPLVVLGVTGGIAAYKSADLIRRLKDQDLDVQVIATNSALKFVGETTFAALTGKPVISEFLRKQFLQLVQHRRPLGYRQQLQHLLELLHLL